MSKIQQLIIILIVAFATMITRFLPFIVFPANKETPSYIKYLGKVLPAAVLVPAEAALNGVSSDFSIFI